jgi:hypothetical protein
MITRMSDEDKPWSFEDALRQIADEVTRGIERFQSGELENIARNYGIDPDRARRFVDNAGEWLRAQAENVNFEFETEATSAPVPQEKPATSDWDFEIRGAGPDPLDMPTDDQGRALAALDSGRWTIEPGTSALSGHGEGPGPNDALGLVRELRVRDWIDADGDVTLTGRAALRRWLDN